MGTLGTIRNPAALIYAVLAAIYYPTMDGAPILPVLKRAFADGQHSEPSFGFQPSSIYSPAHFSTATPSFSFSESTLKVANPRPQPVPVACQLSKVQPDH